jgi:ABC-2 type transport system permease protein
MKGLLLKDFYLIRKSLLIMFLTFVALGATLSALITSWALIPLGAIMFETMVTTTINTDRNSGWHKVSGVLPVSRKCVIQSKYMLYLILGAIGIILGVVACVVISNIYSEWNYNSFLLFFSLSFTMALISGSITLPCSFIFSEDKSMIGQMIAYPASAFIFAGLVFPAENKTLMFVIAILISIVFYGASCIFSNIYISRKDIA